MSNASVMITIMVIIMILAGITALSGIGMLIFGLAKVFVNRRNRAKADDPDSWKSPGKRPLFFFVLGSILVAAATTYFFYASITIHSYRNAGPEAPNDYGSLPAYWTAVEVSDGEASVEAVNTLLDAAFKDDSEKFASTFSERTREKEDFYSNMKEFMRVLPEELDHVGLRNYGAAPSEVTIGDHVVTEYSARFTAVVEDEEYFITVKFIKESPGHPEDIGATFITVFDLERQAVYNQMFNDLVIDNRYMYTYLLCEVADNPSISARKIDGYQFVWLDSEDKPMTEEEFNTVIENYDTLADAIEEGAIPEPNVSYSPYDSERCDYYFELSVRLSDPPIYACVSTSGELGPIISVAIVSEN